MSNRFAGKVCVITGTGGSIGREAALSFARGGARVVGSGMRLEDAEATVAAVRAAGGTMVSLQPCDLTKPEDCQALVDLAVHSFGRRFSDALAVPKRSRTSLCSWRRTTART